MTGPQRRQSAIAAVVSVMGVLGILAYNAHRQTGRVEERARAYAGEQWDVARRCFVGTPIGRGEGAPAIADRLEARLYETLVQASESRDELDLDLLWPAHCVQTLPSLRGAAEQAGDRERQDALAELAVLAPRVLARGTPGPSEFLVDEAPTRARALAEAIAMLDEVMPPGAAYEASDFPAPSVPAPMVAAARDGECRRSARWPLFPSASAAAGATDLGDAPERPIDVWEDRAGSARLTREEDGTVRRYGSDARGEEVSLDAGRLPRLVSVSGELGWLEGDPPELVLPPAEPGGERQRHPLELPPDDAPIDAWFGCQDRAGEVRFVIARRDDTVIAAPLPPEPGWWSRVRPAPPNTGVAVSCSADALLLAWTDAEGDGMVVRCGGGSCAALPRPPYGIGLQVASVAGRVLMTSRGARTDLTVARMLIEDEDGARWSEPHLGVPGALSVDEAVGRFFTECGAMSEDGAVWEPSSDP